MSHAYHAVGWNRQKKVYDTALLAGVIFYMALLLAIGT